MGKLVANYFISLDGVVEAPDKWHFPYFNDEMGAAVGAGMQENTAFMMGRVLYEEWSAYWTQASDDDPTAAYFNNVPKYVVSSTLTDPTWSNTTVVPGDPARIREIVEKNDGNIGIAGSATLVRWLLAMDLLDELHLMIHPIAVGRGQRLFEDTPTHALRLVSTETFATGVLNTVYVPAKS